MVNLRASLIVLVSACGGCSFLVRLDDLTAGRSPDAGGELRDVGGPMADAASPPTAMNIAQNQQGPLGITVSATHVYWVTRTVPALIRADKDGANSVSLASTSDALQQPFDVAVDGEGSIYWSEFTMNIVYRKRLDGGGKTAWLAGPTVAAYLAVSGDDTFVTDYAQSGIGMGRIVSKKNGAIWSEPEVVAGLAEYGQVLFWSRLGTGHIYSGGIAGGPNPSKIAEGVGRASGVAVDDQNIYWIADNQKLMSLPRNNPGLGARTVYDAGERFGDSDVAVDATHIYWTQFDSGLVRRIAKR